MRLLALVLGIAAMLSPLNALAFVPPSTAVETIPLRVSNETALTRPAEHARGGVAFLPASVIDLAALHVYTGAGVEVPIQAHPLGLSYPDGSLRHVLVQFVAEAMPAHTSLDYFLTVEPTRLDHPAVAQPVVVTPATETGGCSDPGTDAGGLVVDTGVMTVRLKKNCFRLPNQVTVGGTSLITDASAPEFRLDATREYLTDATAPVHFGLSGFPAASLHYLAGGVRTGTVAAVSNAADDLAGAVELRVEEQGPLRVVVRVARGHEVPGRFGFVARLYFYSGQAHFRTELTLINEEGAHHRPLDAWSTELGLLLVNDPAVPDVKHINEFTYRLTAPWSSPVVTPASDQTVRPWESGPRSATAAEGWMRLASPTEPDASITLANQYFREAGPKRLRSVGAALENMMLTRFTDATTDAQRTEQEQQLYLGGGHSRTYRFVLAFNNGAGSPRTGQQVQALAQHELLVQEAPPEASRRETYFRFVPDTSFAGLRDFHDRSRACEDDTGLPCVGFAWRYGDREFGERTGNGGGQENGQYGPAKLVLTRYRSSGDLRDFRRGEAMLHHAMNTDIVSWSPNPDAISALPDAADLLEGRKRYYAGAREPRTQATVPLGVYRHQTFEHVYDNHSLYYNDLVAWYFLTGDRRVVDLLLPVAAFPGVGDETQVPGRSGAFTREFFVPFVAFLDAWEVIGHEDAVTDVLLADGPDYRLTSSRAAHLTNPSRQPELSLAAASAMARGIRSMYQSVVGFWTRNLAGSPHASAMTPDFSLIDPTFTPANHQEFLLLDTHVDPFPFQPAGTTSCRSDLLRNGVCIPASIPSVGPTEAVALLEHTVEAIHRYRELTGVDYTRYVLWHTAEYQHLFRNPFGSFIYKPFQQYERLHVNHSNTAAASAFEFAAWGDPLAAQRLDEATVSVDARIRILGRENAFMGTDNDLHPFLYAWRARWEGEGVTDGTAFDRIATTAVTVAANRLNLMPPFLYAHPDPITAPSPIPTSGPGMNWTLPRRVFWDTWWGLPAYEYISAPIFLATGADATVQVTALNELFGELVRTELSAGAIDPPFAHLWLSRANRVRGAASHDDNMAAGIGSIATSARDAVLCYELRRRSDTSYRNLCGPIDQTYP